MNIALFETSAEAEGFRELLREVVDVESFVAPADGAFAVDVLRPADFVAGVVYVLYYVKGLGLGELAGRPRDERIELLREHLVHYAVGGRTWDPPATGLQWYRERAALEAGDVDAVAAEAERLFRDGKRRRSLLGRLFGGKR